MNVMRGRAGRIPELAATILAVVLILDGLVVGCSGGSGASQTPSPTVTPTLFAPAPTPRPTQAPTVAPTTSATLSPSPTRTLPPAGSYPVVNSCNPASVPGSIPVPPAPARARSFTLHVPVLMYHRVVPFSEAGNSIRSLVVPPDTFSAQMGAIAAAGWHTITMAKLADDLDAHVTPPAKTFVVTFDDGWNDGYTYALPILQHYGFVATYFVIATRIDHPGFLSSAQLLELMAAGDEIGDHTFDHLELSAIIPTRSAYQINVGASRIAQVTGRWPESLAYPYGGVTSRVAGQVAACSQLHIAVLEKPLLMIYPGTVPAPGATPRPARKVYLESYETTATRFEVPRIAVSPSTSPSALLRALGSG